MLLIIHVYIYSLQFSLAVPENLQYLYRYLCRFPQYEDVALCKLNLLLSIKTEVTQHLFSLYYEI